ncbi:unnamed protein product [Nippostrongylus brasiliensis]|uniref:Apyrase n=1 Tax=Nippostrongylus brasiliensis TaxID=27835 RepID=A0A0N4XF20_NIPBR|nr:unnamed protein product [Nippostrongylus brasiliensis]
MQIICQFSVVNLNNVFSVNGWFFKDAAQLTTVVRLGRSTETAKSYFEKAYEENKKALELITKLPFRYEVYRKSEKDFLTRAQKDLKQLLDGTSQSRITTSTWALFWQVGAQFAKEDFDWTRCESCNKTSTIKQQAIAFTITAITKEPTLSPPFKIQVEDLTKNFIFENGTIKPGVSEDNMYELGWNVTDIIGGDYPFQ